MRGRAWCLLALLVPARAGAEERVVQRTADGSIDWTELTVTAEGSGVAPQGMGRSQGRLAAEAAALADARRRVLAVLGQASLDGERRVESRLQDDRVRVQAQGLLDTCTRTSLRYLEDGSVDLGLECRLDGGLSAILLPPVAEPAAVPEGEGDGAADGPTGLILVVSGEYEPELAPRIQDTQGRTLYDLTFVGSNALRRWGPVAYATSVEGAQAMERVGARPRVLPATVEDGRLTVTGAGPGRPAALYEGRVVVVVGAPG